MHDTYVDGVNSTSLDSAIIDIKIKLQRYKENELIVKLEIRLLSSSKIKVKQNENV